MSNDWIVYLAQGGFQKAQQMQWLETKNGDLLYATLQTVIFEGSYAEESPLLQDVPLTIPLIYLNT